MYINPNSDNTNILSKIENLKNDIKKSKNSDEKKAKKLELKKLEEKISVEDSFLDSLTPTSLTTWNSYDKAFKDDMAKRVQKMYFKHVDTKNLSMYNFTDIQIDNDRLLKNLIETTRITELDDINNLIDIKYSKCNDIDISKCIQNNVSTGNLICELVKIRDLKKLPKTFLDDFEYKRTWEIMGYK